MKKYVLGFRYNHEGVILIKKSKPDWQRGLWNGIGGSIERGEAPFPAMCREFYEETGIVTGHEDWDCVMVMSGHDWMMYVFSSYAPDGGHEGLIPECDEGHVALCKELPANLEQTAAWLVRYVMDHSISGVSVDGGQRSIDPIQVPPILQNEDMQSGGEVR